MGAAKEYLEDGEPVLKTALNYTYVSQGLSGRDAFGQQAGSGVVLYTRAI